MAALLSVIVPAYGVGEYLPACLDSILAQTLTDLEVIVVDDGSPDESGEIADDFASRDSRVRVLHNENEGLGGARNSGARVATGKYITFADSDDLIPPRAYELLVSTLEQTGSDIAAGNTWRYIEGRGNVQSWTHAEAFAETKLRTHIREFPLLIRDRMVWNKVYRHSFWKRGGYQFPHIRYEDYPVTLPAHLDAGSVDVISDKVYLWRQRIAEESITQRSLELDNLTDRVTSALMTLDVADAEGGEIQTRLHSYFTDIDVVTVATALAEGEECDRPAVEELAVTLAGRLHPSDEHTTPLARQIHAAFLRKDFDAAIALAEVRRGGSKADVLKLFMQPSRCMKLPGLLTSLARGGKPKGKTFERPLRSKVLGVVRMDGQTVVQVESRLRRLLLERANTSAHLVAGDRRIPVETHVTAFNGQRATTEVAIPDALVIESSDEAHQLEMTITVGPLTWHGAVNIGSREIPGPEQLSPETWGVVSRWVAGSYHLWVRRVPHDNVADVYVDDESLTVTTSNSSPYAAVLRPAPSRPLVAPLVDGVARFALSDVLDDPADDPVTSRAYRDVVALTQAAVQRLNGGDQQAARLVDEATGDGVGETNSEVIGELESDVVPEGIQPETVDDEEQRAETISAEHQLTRTGIFPLVLHDYTEEPVEFDGKRVMVRRSPSGTAEIHHQLLDHLGRR